jgi:hypothetical protein
MNGMLLSETPMSKAPGSRKLIAWHRIGKHWITSRQGRVPLRRRLAHVLPASRQ